MKLYIFCLTTALLSGHADASTNYKCGSEQNVRFTVDGQRITKYSTSLGEEGVEATPVSEVDGVAQYEFRVSDQYDTNTWYDVYLKDEIIIKKEVYESGNDSDNYQGWLVRGATFDCVIQND
jgi:hypothetical protein